MDKEHEIVVTSRIRLARNLKNYKFPVKMTGEESNEIIDAVNNAIKDKDLNFKLTYMRDLTDVEKFVFIEKHFISPALSENKNNGAFLLSADDKISIMINEEDHIRIQTLGYGMCLNECWEQATKVDDMLEEHLDYAFDKELGYIASCPTNIGTGMRASVMLHLPALSMTNQMDRILFGISQLGIAVRGVYGEGTKSMGHLFQISNQGTLGATEETLIEKISQIVMQIVQKEQITREQFRKNNFDDIEDQIHRAYGILTNARSICSDEAMKLLSYVKLGKEMGIMSKVDNKNLYGLMVEVQPNNILSNANEQLNLKERDKIRAEIIRNKLLG
ncbi:MAG: protein arginine kinase [Bacillota bacterium]|nr:protein arginine kinase [Bacillota bacterium]